MSEKNSSTIKLDKNSELRRARRTKLFFVFLLFVLLILGGVVGFLRKKEFQISEVTISGTKSLDPEVVLKSAHEYLNGHYAIIIPKTNTLLLSKSDLVAHILEQVPSLQKATITFKKKNSIEIAVNEKKPSYVWCGTKCYFVDNTGMIYEESPQFTQGVFMTFFGGTVSENPIKNHFISEKQFGDLLKIVSALHQLTIHVLDITITDDISFHIDTIKNTTLGAATKIIILKDGSGQDIVDALGLLMNDKAFMGALATRGQLLQYIDVRFPDKIYYKFDAQLLDKTQ